MKRLRLSRPAMCRASALGTFRIVLVALALAAVVPAAHAQLGFTEYAITDTTLNSSPETDFWIASAAPADVDADGDLDLLIAGYYVVYNEWFEDRLTLYRNDGFAGGTTWALTPIPVDVDLNFSAGDIAWGDFDNDGDPDAVVGAYGETVLYRNDAGTLVRTPTVLPAYWEDSDWSTLDLHSFSWADVDNDGDLDLLLPSTASGWDYNPTLVLRNEGPGVGDAWIFSDTAADLPVAPNAVSAWADMEGDGDLDLLLGNVSPYGGNFLETFRNTGELFARADTGLAYIRYGTADWGDADNDGDLDIVYAGNMDLPNGMGEEVVKILFNDPETGYTPVTVTHDFNSPEEPWLDFTAVTWADYDSDGDVDLLVSGEWLGEGEIFGRSVVYANTAGTFALGSEPLPAPISGQAGGAFTWFDVDSDGDLDYFVAGGYYVPDGQGLIEARTQLFRNDAGASNQAPGAPPALAAVPISDGATLSWGPAIDDRTPQSALTYELEISALGAPVVSERAIPEPGNVSRNTSWSVQGLEPGVYSWSVRALDNAFNGGAVSEGSFVVGTVDAPDAGAPRALALSSPYPNPARPGSRMTVFMPREGAASVALFDASGRRVAVLHEGTLAAGAHEFAIGGARLSSGAYFVRAEAGGETARTRVTFVR